MLASNTRVLLPLAAVASAVLMASAAPRAAPVDEVELEVLGVLPLAAETSSLLVLREKGARTLLPIFVGRSEGAAIRHRLAREPERRPAAAELLQRTIDALGGKVMRVELQGAQPALFRARVTLQQNGRKLDVEARPSDSIALAVTTRAPIFTRREVLAESGLSHEDLERLRPSSEGEEESSPPGPVSTF